MSYVILETSDLIPAPIYGPYADLITAQTAANSFASSYASGKSDVTAEEGTNVCVCVRTVTTPNTVSGVTYTGIQQFPERKWTIIELISP